jgi:RNA polymerase sigma-70 factor, ECF subfamily
MATTALQLELQAIPSGCHQRRIEELNDVVIYYSRRFRRIAQAHLGDAADAEDAVQDAVLSALTHMHQFKGEAKMSTWLTSIVINASRMKLRKRSASVQLSLDEIRGQDHFPLSEVIPDTRLGPEAEYHNQEIGEMLTDAISRLSPILRRTFELRDVRGLSIREAAHLMGVPSGTVKARLARARMRLRKVMAKASGRTTRREMQALAEMVTKGPFSQPVHLGSAEVI